MPALRADGTEFPVELAISSTRLEGGAFLFTAYLRDITERKRAEEALSFLAAIVESSDDAVVGKDLNSDVVSWNAGAQRMFGYTTAEMLGQPITRLLSPDRPDEEIRILEEVKRGKTRHLETVRLHRNGRPIDVSLTVSPIKNPRGEIIGLSSIARDVTTRNLVLRELRKSELQLRLIWENSLDGLRLVDREGIITMVNEAYCRLVEKPRAALEGQPLSVLYEPHRHQEVMRQHRGRFAERCVPQHLEREVTLWNHKKLFLELSNSFLDVEGRPALLVTTFRNITERRQAEQREAAFAKLARSLSAAASAASAASVIADVAHELIGWDACSLDLYAAEQDKVYPVINIEQGKHLDVPPAYQAQPPSLIVRKVLAEGGQLILRQPPCQFPPGSVPFGDTARPSASLMYVPVRLGQQIIGILSVQSYSPNAYNQNSFNTLQTLADQCAGALERIRAEEKVRQLNEQLEQRVRERTAELIAANQEMEAFTYSVAHDLRAPLRHIDAFSRILYEDFADSLSPEAKHYLENILRGSRNMSRLVEDLLNLARVGRQELNRQPTALSGVVHDVLADLKRETEGRNIEWHIQPLPTIECDSGLMKQVFANLLSNAVKYTRPRPVAVIEVGSVKSNGQTSVFVRDNGVGFSMKYADKLFGVFQRLHRSEEFEGTGVGLATVDRIIRKHGGSVWAESAEDQGATFYFSIPGMEQPSK
jgi:PAS domain S-box-containing protein